MENANGAPYIPQTVKETIQTRSHTKRDRWLNLIVNVGVEDFAVVVVVQVKPSTRKGSVDENGWPIGFFDQVVGSMPEVKSPPQGRLGDSYEIDCSASTAKSETAVQEIVGVEAAPTLPSRTRKNQSFKLANEDRNHFLSSSGFFRDFRGDFH